MRVVDVLPARREDVEDEAAAGLEELARGQERVQLLLLRLHVQERAEGADRERHALGNRGLAKVADPEVEEVTDPGGLRGGARDREHLRRGVDADDLHARFRDRDCDPPRADGELDHRPAGRERLLDVEADVLRHRAAPGVVEPRDPVVERHVLGLRATQTNSRLSSSNGRRSNQP